MLEISEKTNLLEQKSYKYSLQDVSDPNLQRDIYSYGTVPKVSFNHRRVPMNMPEEIWITDTTLRDGQQSVEPYSVEQIVQIYKYLNKLGGPFGIIRQTEFFIYSKKDRTALEKCNELQMLSREAGIPVKIRACDTMGYGVPFTEAAMPRSVAGIIYGLQHYSDVPSECLEWHGHNDFYKAVSNASTAWLYGACAVNCSLLGIGERTGNIPLEAMVFEYASLRGSMDGMDPTVITEIAEYFQKEIGYEIPPMTPFAGRSFNSTRAGIHADGLMKDAEIYTIFDTEKLLNRPATVEVGKASGAAGVAYWINQQYGLPEEKKLTKNHPVVIKIKEWIDQEYENGR